MWQLLGHSCNSLSPDNGVNTQANIQRSQCCRYYWPTVLKTMWRNVCLFNVTDLFVPVVHCFISQHLWPTFAHYLTLTTVWGYMWFFIYIFVWYIYLKNTIQSSNNTLTHCVKLQVQLDFCWSEPLCKCWQRVCTRFTDVYIVWLQIACSELDSRWLRSTTLPSQQVFSLWLTGNTCSDITERGCGHVHAMSVLN